jgi:hypothetical protein
VVYDIKTTVTGRLTTDQADRLKTATGLKAVKSVGVKERYTAASGWQTNSRFTTAVKIFSAVGAVASFTSSANAMIHISDYDDELDNIIMQSNLVRRETDSVQRTVAAASLLSGPVRQYILHFAPNSPAVDIGIAVAIRGLIEDP